MASKAKKIENLSDEALDLLLAKGDEMEFEESKVYSLEETEFLFEYLHACVFAEKPQRATEVFHALKPAIDAQLADPETRDDGLENLLDWASQAIRLTPEERNKFVLMPVYRELFDAFKDVEGRLAARETRARIQLLFHIDIWLEKGGNLSNLEEEDQQLVEETRESIWESADAMIATCKEAEYWDELVSLHRTIGNYYLHKKKINEAIAHLKSVAETLPSTSDFDPRDQGDQYIDIGKIFYLHKKYPTAQKYFGMALEVFEQLEDEDGLFVLKAEGWLEEVGKSLS